VLMNAGEGGEAGELRVGIYIPAWKSRSRRLGSRLAVSLLSILGAAPAVLPHLSRPVPHLCTFLALLVIRWLMSAALGTSLTRYTLRKA